MTKIQIITGSTRPGRLNKQVADWVYEVAQQRTDIEVELVDIADYNLPLLDEPAPPATGQKTKDHTKRWAAKISEADGYVFVTPEYNHAPSAALKNAIDFVNHEWNNKAVAFVSYGWPASGLRAVEQLRQIVAEVQLADINKHVAFAVGQDFKDDFQTLNANDKHVQDAQAMLDQLAAWAGALKTIRT